MMSAVNTANTQGQGLLCMTDTYCEKECLLKNVKSKLCIIFTMYVCNETSEPHVLNLYVSEGGFSVMLCTL